MNNNVKSKEYLKVLSVDVDVFFKCVQYQSWQDEELTPLQSWQVIKWKSEAKGFTDELFKPDYETIELVKNILQKKCSKSQPYIIVEHDEIYDILKSLPTKYNHVTNIDNHHDIGYRSEETSLDISNWVALARRDGYLLDYVWIGRDDSQLPEFNMFNYIKSSWRDVNVDALPEYDIVVFCTSKHYTPPQYWNLGTMLRDYLVEVVQGDMVECEEPEYNAEDFPDFEGQYSEAPVDTLIKWWRHNGLYVNGELIDDTMWLSIINIEGRRQSILSTIARHVDKVISEYKQIGFCWNDGYKSEVLIKRLAKRYSTVNSYSDSGMNYLILKEV